VLKRYIHDLDRARRPILHLSKGPGHYTSPRCRLISPMQVLLPITKLANIRPTVFHTQSYNIASLVGVRQAIACWFEHDVKLFSRFAKLFGLLSNISQYYKSKPSHEHRLSATQPDSIINAPQSSSTWLYTSRILHLSV